MITADERTFVRKFINNNCIDRLESNSQFYLREAFYNPKILDIIVRHFFSRYEEPIKNGAIQLCGVESSSTPLLTGISLECYKHGYDVNIFSIRQYQEAYGRKNWLEGKVFKDKPAMLIDDIVSVEHKTTIHGALVLANPGIPIANHVYTLVYETDKPENNKIKLLGNEVTVSSMFNLNHFDLSLKMYSLNKQLEMSIDLKDQNTRPI